MKRTFVVIISAVLLILFSGCLFGCQATPENPILVEKDSERLIEQAGKKDNGVSLSDILHWRIIISLITCLKTENYRFMQMHL